ncbi:transposase, partial [Burkholderia sp. Ac-20384]|uniref:transposase n=1 Tax=Burkholderia sp. Ac-20384 TaxID=2703902 RepID=UPI001F122079
TGSKAITIDSACTRRSTTALPSNTKPYALLHDMLYVKTRQGQRPAARGPLPDALRFVFSSSSAYPWHLHLMICPAHEMTDRSEKAWEQWIEQAQQSGIAALQKFAGRLQGYWHGIVARCRHPLNTSVVEGINNTIKVIKRRAYGYRDEEYFFLKIRAAFPGNPR